MDFYFCSTEDMSGGERRGKGSGVSVCAGGGWAVVLTKAGVSF